MLKFIKKLCLSSLFILSNVNATDKMYIDKNDLDDSQDTFHIHIGENVWIETNTVHRDTSGLYTFEKDVKRDLREKSIEYKKKWKCPYCSMYWPIGTACQNKECPSKYK